MQAPVPSTWCTCLFQVERRLIPWITGRQLTGAQYAFSSHRTCAKAIRMPTQKDRSGTESESAKPKVGSSIGVIDLGGGS